MDQQPTAPTGGSLSSRTKNPFRLFGRACRGLLLRTARRRHPRRHRPNAFASMSAALSDCFEDEASTSSRPLSEFPMVLEGHGGQGHQKPELRLVTVGSRHWGSASWWDTRSLLKIKIYDFAVYADSAAVHAQSQFFRLGHRGARSAEGQGDVLAQLVQTRRPAGALDATVMLHAARNLPLEQLAQELQGVLERRNVKAGGPADDPALSQLIGLLSRDAIPPSFLTAERDHVRRGGILTFQRSCGAGAGLQGGGEAADEPDACKIVALAGDQVLGSVTSRSLGTALLDLYLGDDPVSAKAKAAAAHSLARMARNRDAFYLPRGDDAVVCQGSGPEACSIQLR